MNVTIIAAQWPQITPTGSCGKGARFYETALFRSLMLAAVPALAPGVAFAAHAGAPYTNVDHSNDMGNDTGDSRVEGLNSAQLNRF